MRFPFLAWGETLFVLQTPPRRRLLPCPGVSKTPALSLPQDAESQ